MIINNEKYNRYYRRIVGAYQQPVLSASIEIILSVFAIALMVGLAIRPTLTIVASLQKKIEDQKLVEQKLTAKINSLNQAQKSLGDNANKLFLYERAVPDKYELDQTAKRLELLAQETGCQIESIGFGEVALLGNLDNKDLRLGEVWTTPISMSLQGTLSQLSDFMVRAEKMDRLLLIENVAIQKPELRKKTTSGLNLTIKASIYYLGKVDEG